MIGHEAVRRNCEPLLVCGAPNLRQHEINGRCPFKTTFFVMAGERERVAIQADVAERLEMAGCSVWHGDTTTQEQVRTVNVRLKAAVNVRLKADATNVRVQYGPSGI